MDSGFDREVKLFAQISDAMYLKYMFLILLGLFLSYSYAQVPVKDNLLFAFEKCKSLQIDLKNGQLLETKVSSFDLHCRKPDLKSLEFSCSFYDSKSSKASLEKKFTGGSNLGVGELQSKEGDKIQFLIGKGFASFESGTDRKTCIGIFVFEKEALKRSSMNKNL